jgi:hypothetical protein
MIDLTKELVTLANYTLTDETLSQIDATRSDFFERIGCRLILLPSGAELKQSMVEATGGIIFGKLLYGGVSRYRLLSSSTSSRAARRVGERNAIQTSWKERVPSWIQFGGTERKYEAVDMGPAAVLEVTLLPRGKKMDSILDNRSGDMALSGVYWSPRQMFSGLGSDDERAIEDKLEDGDEVDKPSFRDSAASLSGKERNDAFKDDFRSAVGGLSSQIEAIVRRVLDGRVLRPADADEGSENGSSTGMMENSLSAASLEAEELALLGLTPVRGLLLYGPPGCGK